MREWGRARRPLRSRFPIARQQICCRAAANFAVAFRRCHLLPCGGKLRSRALPLHACKFAAARQQALQPTFAVDVCCRAAANFAAALCHRTPADLLPRASKLRSRALPPHVSRFAAAWRHLCFQPSLTMCRPLVTILLRCSGVALRIKPTIYHDCSRVAFGHDCGNHAIVGAPQRTSGYC